jgi:HupE / UreJ protein
VRYVGVTPANFATAIVRKDSALASALIELDLSRETLVRALIGFNVGVELGQLALVAVVMPPLAWASRPGRLPRLPQILSAAVAVVGAVWLVERVLAA